MSKTNEEALHKRTRTNRKIENDGEDLHATGGKQTTRKTGQKTGRGEVKLREKWGKEQEYEEGGGKKRENRR